MKKYIEDNYSLNFTKINREWVSGNITIKADNQWYEGSKSGNIVNWVAKKENCVESQAVGIINSKCKQPYNYKSQLFIELEKVFGLVATRYRIGLSYNKKVEDFLKSLNIDIDFAQNTFSLGALKTDNELRDSLKKLYKNPDDYTTKLYLLRITKKHFLNRKESWVVPVKDKNNEIQGFHGIDEKNIPFFSGWLYTNRNSVLFGESYKNIVNAIKGKKRVIVTDGVIGFLHWQQNKYKEVLASMTGSIAPKRFDELFKEPITHYFFGFTEDKRRKVLVGLALQNVKNKPLKFTNSNPFANQPKVSKLDNILKKALKEKVNEDEALWGAAIARYKEIMEVMVSEGLVYRIKVAELKKELEKSKGSHKKLQVFLKEKQLDLNNMVNTNHITLSATFDGRYLESELRTLLFLLSKKKTDTPIRYNKSNLADDLGIKVRRLSQHLNTLVEERYLLKRHKNYGKKVVLYLEPGTIPFNLEGSI